MPQQLNVPRTSVSPDEELSPWAVLIKLLFSARGLTAFLLTALYGLIVGTIDPTYAISSVRCHTDVESSLTLRVETVWNKKSSFVGLVYRTVLRSSLLCLKN